MAANPNALVWDGGPGHYEVHYVTLTDRATGTGLWIRLTLRAPTTGAAECHLWFLAMDPDGRRFARKETYPVARLERSDAPFRLGVADAVLTDTGTEGRLGPDVSWDLRWDPRDRPAEPVHPLLRRLGVAQTVFRLPHPDLTISGRVAFDGRELEITDAKGGQAHLHGSKHARRWSWLHCNDLAGEDGAPAETGTFVEAVSVEVERRGRRIAATPVVAHVLGEPLDANGPVTVMRTKAAYDLETLRFETASRTRRLVVEARSPRPTLVGVTYHDPDGELAYCYNSEVASARVEIRDRERGAWRVRQTLVADGTAHLEYAQRTPVPGMEMHLP